uniref:Uncharacterized protein n=1 Tax=Arundo donax TaxID=35708 RepID=A0A0A8ZWS3_ARUDO
MKLLQKLLMKWAAITLQYTGSELAENCGSSVFATE